MFASFIMSCLADRRRAGWNEVAPRVESDVRRLYERM